MPDAAGAGRRAARRVIVTVMALAAAAGVVAVELNRLPDGRRPAVARALWPSYPDAVRDDAMRDVGLAAARGNAVPDGVRVQMRRFARSAPLRPDPFLVEATVAATAEDGTKAEQLFAEAAARDPRSVLARYALADRALRTNRLTDGLAQISILIRLVPGAADSLTGPLAMFARQPDSQGVLHSFFARSPQIAPAVLSELVKDPSQANRAIALAKNLPLAGDKAWQLTLVQTLIERGDYLHAQEAWRTLNGIAPYPGLFNPKFQLVAASEPFNWSPWEAKAALVEPAPGGGLKLVYYGREDTMITRQLLVLAPGRYQLAMAVAAGPLSTAGNTSADQAAELAWRVSCVDSGAPLGTLPLRVSASSRATLRFGVPTTCHAQWLSLNGTASGFGEPVSIFIRDLALRAEIGS